MFILWVQSVPNEKIVKIKKYLFILQLFFALVILIRTPFPLHHNVRLWTRGFHWRNIWT